MNRAAVAIAVSICVSSAFAQPVAFEVASVKLSPPSAAGKGFTVHGGPGSSDPGLATFTNIDLDSLIAMAFGIERHQVSAPEWASATYFDITARVASRATQDQYRLMLQNLLAERFQLALHRDTKILQVYELVVAKNGPKLSASSIDSAGADDGLQPPHPIPSLPPGFHGPVNVTLDNATIEPLVNDLEGLIGEPVVDATGLTGRYTVRLHVSFGLPPLGEGELFEALEEQLGLRLIQKKPIDIVVIDHLERLPTEN